MSWTYSNDPSASDLDALRFTIQDTDSADQKFSNEELDWLLTEHGSVRSAAIAAAQALVAKYASKVDKAVGDLRLSLSHKHKHYLELVKQLKSQGALLAMPYAGGISKSDKETREDDSDRVEAKFAIDMHEYYVSEPEVDSNP